MDLSNSQPGNDEAQNAHELHVRELPRQARMMSPTRNAHEQRSHPSLPGWRSARLAVLLDALGGVALSNG